MISLQPPSSIFKSGELNHFVPLTGLQREHQSPFISKEAARQACWICRDCCRKLQEACACLTLVVVHSINSFSVRFLDLFLIPVLHLFDLKP